MTSKSGEEGKQNSLRSSPGNTNHSDDPSGSRDSRPNRAYRHWTGRCPSEAGGRERASSLREIPMVQILVVDDEAAIRRLVCSILEEKGYKCLSASSVREAKPLLEKHRPQLLVTDIRLPGESGLDLIREARGTYPDMATVVMSAIEDLEVAETARDLGVYGYILKPLNRVGLLITVSNALHRRQLERINQRHENHLSELVQERTVELQKTIFALERAKQELQDSRRDYELLIKNLPCVIYKGFADWSVDLLSGSFRELTGYTREAMRTLGIGWADLIHPDDFESAKAATREALRGNGAFIREYRIRTRDQEITWVQDRGQIVCDDRGRIRYIQGVFYDITAQKNIEQKIIRAKKQWEATFDAVPDLIAILDDRHRIRRINRPMAERLGISPQQAIGSPCYSIVHGTNGPIAGCPHSCTLSDGCEHQLEISEANLNGHFLVSTSPLFDPDGKLTGSVHVARDISRQHQAVRELRQAHREMEQLIDSISSILIGIDTEGRIKRWNRLAEQTFGIPEDEAIGCFLEKCPISLQWEKIRPSVTACLKDGVSKTLSTISYTRQDGKEGFLQVSLNPIANGHGIPRGLLILASDITEQRILEGQLSQAQKLEAIGQLAAGIAHEINTPIQYVSDNLYFLKDAFTDLIGLLEMLGNVFEAARSGPVPAALMSETQEAAEAVDLNFLKEEVPTAISQSREGVDRVAQIVRSMKEFSHPGVEEKIAVDLNKGLQNTITVAKNEWKYVAEMEMDLDADLPPVYCLPGEINQVFLNLIINAAQAIGEQVPKGSADKGTIRISSRKVENGVEIRIADSGPGIPEEIRNRIFDPFFTTKEVGKGTGQGLAISHAVIVEKHGGFIHVESETGKGTTFIIFLPFGPAEGEK